MSADTDSRPPLAGRMARRLGTFNVCYGLLGLLSAAVIRFAFPPGSQPMPDAALLASAAASCTAILQGVLLRVYGPAMTGFVGRAATRLRVRLVACVRGGR